MRLRTLMISLLAVFALGAVSSASASAADCLKVAEPGTGHWEKNTCTTPVGTTNEYVEVEKVETQLKPGEWCAKVKAGEPSRFSNNTCTTAHVGTGEFTKVKVSVDEWEVCKKEGTEEYTTNQCATKAAGGKFSWEVLGAGVTENITSKKVPGSGPEVLTAGGNVLTCTSATGNGTITGGKPGTDLTTSLSTGCTINEAGCSVKTTGRKNGEIEWSNIPTKLEHRKNEKGTEVVVDNFESKENAKKEKEIATYHLEGTCPGGLPGEFRLTGTIAAEVKNLSDGKVELNFPEPQLEKDTLEAFGARVNFTSRDELSLENGGALRAK